MRWASQTSTIANSFCLWLRNWLVASARVFSWQFRQVGPRRASQYAVLPYPKRVYSVAEVASASGSFQDECPALHRRRVILSSYDCADSEQLEMETSSGSSRTAVNQRPPADSLS